MERPATSRRRSASTYPCRSLSGSVQVNGVDGVVLVVIQITDDPSAERTAPPRSTHVRLGDVSSLLIQQGERRSRGKTPTSRRRGGDGARGSPAGLRQALRRRMRCWRRKRAAPGKRSRLPSHPSTIYRGKGRGGGALGFPLGGGG